MKCKKCFSEMIVKDGSKGSFMACPGWPECKYTEDITESTGPIAPSKEYHLTDEECRARALECAIESSTMAQKQEKSEIIKLAEVYNQYIMMGL